MGEWKSLSMANGSAGYEDFTAFTEVDIGADRIQKTTNHIDHNANMDETTYLYKDYGVGNFGNFTHKIKVRMTSGDNSITTYTWMLANELNDAYHLYNLDKDFIGIKMSRTGGSYSIYIYESDGGVLYYDNWTNASSNTWYYIKIVKSGTSLNAYIYSDADYTVLEDTLTLTLQSDYTFRYLYGCNTWNNASGYNSIMDIENFDIGSIPWSYINIESGSGGWKGMFWDTWIYDGFEDGFSGWGGDTSEFAQSSTYHYVGSYSLKKTGADGHANGWIYHTAPSQNIEVEVRIRNSTTLNKRGGVAIGITDGNYLCAYLEPSAQRLKIAEFTNAGAFVGYKATDNIIMPTSAEWVRVRMVKSGNVYTAYLYNESGSELGTCNYEKAATVGRVGIHMYDIDAYLDEFDTDAI